MKSGVVMTGQSNGFPTIPRETARAAKAVFGPSNFYIQVGDRLKVILEEIQLACFAEDTRNFMNRGAILPLVTFFEFVESLTDSQAADALRTRIDWKYALHLPMNPATLRPTVLCEFRRKVFTDPVNRGELKKLVDRLIEFYPSAKAPPEKFEILTVMAEVCSINRLNWVQQAMYQALGALAGKYPEWLRQIALPHWYGRFSELTSEHNLPASTRQQELAMQKLGADIQYLLEEVQRSNLSGIKEMQEIRALQHIWEHQYEKPGLKLGDQKRASMRINYCDACFNRAG
jgi:transposase